MISPNGKAEPLHYVIDYPDRYEILIDAPMADESTLTVALYKRILKIRVKLREKVVLSDYEIEEYVKRIKLPEDAEEEYEVEVVRAEGPIIVIRMPKLGRP